MERLGRESVDPNLSSYPFLQEGGLSILFSKAGDRHKGKKSQALQGFEFSAFLLQSASGQGLWWSFAHGLMQPSTGEGHVVEGKRCSSTWLSSSGAASLQLESAAIIFS